MSFYLHLNSSKNVKVMHYISHRATKQQIIYVYTEVLVAPESKLLAALRHAVSSCKLTYFFRILFFEKDN